MEPPFERLPGVFSVTSGYTGGNREQPTYEEVSSGFTGHAESVEVLYDPRKVSYQTLLDVYWHNVDPLTPNAQFCDHGEQYRTAIFTHGAEQQRRALASKAAVEARLKQPVVTQIVPASTFWPAEEYHQDYYKKNPVRYKFYRYNCGRDERLAEVWGRK
jgi:peptide-methionine (S)-S-oxide reductase